MHKHRRGMFTAKPSTMLEEQPTFTIDQELETRLENWRRVVSESSGSGKCCAGWAAAYYAQLNFEKMQAMLENMSVSDLETLGAARVSKDDMDGWLIEHAVRSLVQEDQRMVLRCKFVWRSDVEEMRKRLVRFNPRVKRRDVFITLQKAIDNLKLVLASQKSSSKIRSYNLHTRSDPRPKAQAVPVGTPAPKEN